MQRTTTDSSIGSALKKVESYQYPATHLGHLTPDQNDKLEALKKIATDKGYYTPETSDRKASHDDETMLRYLRARKFQPQDAFGQFKDTEDWRRKNKIDNVYETIDIEEFDDTRRLYPQWTGRRDKRGIPVYTYEIAHLTSKRMAGYEKSIAKSKTTAGTTSPKLIRLFALYENLLQFVMPLCSAIPNRPYAETPVSQSNNIVDIAGVGLKQFWNLKQHMQDASTLATAHYPETLDRIFIIGAPSFFPTVWTWVKGWFDPITVSKIFILSKSNMKQTLEMYIDPSNIPRKYGGTLNWQWGEMPSLEPEIQSALEWENPSKNNNGENIFPTGPVKWRKDSNGDMVAVAVGTDKGKKRETVIARLPVQKGLTLGPVFSRLAVENTLFGEPSTTGTHTHPRDDQDYFPATGVTPPSEHDDVDALNQALTAESNQSGVSPGKDAYSHDAYASPAGDSTVGGAAVGGVAVGGAAVAGASSAIIEGQYDPSKNANVPTHTTSDDQYRSENLNAPTRTGTSGTRYDAQSNTLAAGEMKTTTADVVDHGNGDKTRTMEPTTVGQARKNVDVPEAKPVEEEQQAPGYLEQAQTAAAGAAATIGSVGHAAMAKVGLGGASNGEEVPAQETSNNSVGQAPIQEKKEDPRVDKMEDKDVEDFIRSRYASHK